MTIEILSLLSFLALFAVLLLAQPLVMASTSGVTYVAGNRDRPQDTIHPLNGRLHRTVNNSIEAAVLFIPLILLTEVLGVSNSLTQYGAMAFVAARVLYALVYAVGVAGLRTLVWNAGLIALGSIAAGLLMGRM